MKRKIKNSILRTITTIAAALLILSAGCADTPSNVPFIVAVASLTWLILFAYANSAYRRAKR